MKLRGISLENFKAFKSEVTIPLRPITLLFGENSAGKSSIIRAISLIKQSLELAGPSDVLVFRDAAAYDDLGSYSEVVYGHKAAESPLTIGLDVELRDFCEALDRPMLSNESRKTGELSPALDNIRRFFPALRLRMQLEHIEPGIENLSLARFEVVCPKSGLLLLEMRRSNSENVPSQKQSYFCSQMSPFLVMALELGVDVLGTTFDKIINNPRFEEVESPEFPYTSQEVFIVEQFIEQCLSVADEEQDVFALRDSLQKLSLVFKAIVETKIVPEFKLTGNEAFFPGHPAAFLKEFYELMYAIDDVGGGDTGVHMPHRFKSCSWIDNASEFQEPGWFILLLILHVRDCMDFQYRAFGSTRAEPQRWYPARGKTVKDVGLRGEFIAEFLSKRPDTLESVNAWLERLDTGHRVIIHPHGLNHIDLYELRLFDTFRDGVQASFTDVGSGIAQLLPILSQALDTENALIAIQQPELHLHPRLQADLGDFFAECAVHRKNCHFLIETHSEHLMLRLQRLIRREEISHKDVCVLYVARGEEGSTVTELRLDSQGEFIDDWPRGYFPERLREFED